jgi:putative oxidoreductase
MWNYTWQPLLGRILLAVIFLISGVNKIGNFGPTANFMASKGLPQTQSLLIVTIVLEIAAAALLILGFQARWAALALAGFTVLATYFFHLFWTFAGPEAGLQQIMFLKNLAIIGGLLMVVSNGAGRWSLDAKK